jgi:hypothetical protein
MDRKSVAFVASPLPAQLLSLYIKDWNIDTILLSDKSHLSSYNYLLKGNELLKIKILPDNIFGSILVLFFTLLGIKVTQKRVVFFHEAAWPWLDMFITFLKPEGKHLPQINNLGRTLVDYESVASTSAFARVLKWFNLNHLFNIYSVFSGGGEVKKYFFAIKKYPSSIVVYNESYSRALIADKKKKNSKKKKRKVLILSGKDWIADQILVDAFSKIIEMALAANFSCFLKDHPSVVGRLNFHHEKVEDIDPAMPIELIEDDFAFAIGFSSAGFLFFDDRAVSIVDAVENIDENTRILRKQHLTSLVGGDKIQFVSKFSEIDFLFKNCPIQ